jgi:hypothetical protein
VKCARTVGWVFVALSLVGITSCSQPPTSPAPATSPPAPQSAPSDPSLTGVVFQKTEDGRRPISGARIVVVDLLEGPYGNFPWYELASDINGHFSLVAFARRAVKITAYAGSSSGLWNQSGLFQVSAVHPIVEGATSVEIELVRHGEAPRTQESPVLSGVIFESTAEGRRPAADMAVIYSSRRHDGADVYARTDDEGRYRFYGIPGGDGYLLPACTRAIMLPPNYRPVTFAVDVHGDTVLDANCP